MFLFFCVGEPHQGGDEGPHLGGETVYMLHVQLTDRGHNRVGVLRHFGEARDAKPLVDSCVGDDLIGMSLGMCFYQVNAFIK